jgi:hypothetical protein
MYTIMTTPVCAASPMSAMTPTDGGRQVIIEGVQEKDTPDERMAMTATRSGPR